MAFNITWDEFIEPNITAGFNQMLDYANSVTNNYFGLGILISLWTIMFLLFRKQGDFEGMLASTFITTIVAGILRSMDQIGDIVLVTCIVMTGLLLLLMMRKKM